MAYDPIISRTDVQSLIPEDVASDVLDGATEQSAAMARFRRQTMSTNQQRMPVIAALPTAYFVQGDTGLKQATEVNWDNVYLNVEEIATIVPVPDAVLDDTSFDVWGEIRPKLEEAVGQVFDDAVFFGVDKPATWPTAIVPAAEAAGQVTTRGTSPQNEGGIAEDLNQLMGQVEDVGHDVNGFVANRLFRRHLRGARATDGQLIADMSENTIYGSGVSYAMRGLWPQQGTAAGSAGVPELIAGDYSLGVVGVRQDITYKMLDQAVIQDNTGAIIYNLAQQDLTAMRLVFRVAFALPNYVKLDGSKDAVPFSVLKSPDLA